MSSKAKTNLKIRALREVGFGYFQEDSGFSAVEK